MARKGSQEYRDNISKGMKGNTNAVGGKRQHKKRGPIEVDHGKILDRFTKFYRRNLFKKSVARSASFMMFLDADRATQVKYMKRVRKVLK